MTRIDLGNMMKRLRDEALVAAPADCLEPMEGMVTQVDGFRCTARFGELEMGVDEPVIFGGTGTAPNPAEVALAGLGASIQVTLLCYAGYLNIDVGDLQVKLAGALDARGFFDIDPTAPVGFYDIDARVSFTGTATPAELARLFACVEKCCPVLAVFRQPMTVNLSFDQRER
jgi:uncharacterized OsmC-like protein